MKISKQLVGKMVELVWRDPKFDRVKLAGIRRGLSALAIWHERGVVGDISEDVVRIDHSIGWDPGDPAPDEVTCTWIHEALIESLTVYDKQESPRPEGVGGGGT